MPEAPCSLCGTPPTPGARFCGVCGGRLGPPAAATPAAASPAAPAPPSYPDPQVLPAGPARPRPRRALAVGAAALGLVLLAGAVVTGVVLGRGGPGDGDDVDRTAGGDGQAVGVSTAVDVLGAPSTEWSFDPDDVLSGSKISPMSEWYDGPAFGDALAFGGVVVTWVAPTLSSTDTGGGVLVGLDGVTGDVLWELESPSTYPDCRDLDGALLCSRLRSTQDTTTGATEPGPVTLVDPEVGEVVAESAGDYARTELATGTSSPYLFVHGEDSLEVVSLTDDLTTRWTARLDTTGSSAESYPMIDEQPGGDSLGVTSGDLRWVLDADTGEQGEVVRDEALAVEDGYRIESDYEEGLTRVTDLSGFTVLAVPGDSWWDSDRDRIRDGRVGIGDTLWDLTSGDPVWSVPDTDDYLTTVDDGRYVSASGVGDTLLLDHDTGAEVMGDGTRVDLQYGDWYGTDSVMGIGDDGTLRMHDLDGTVRWEQGVSDLLREEGDDDVMVGGEIVATTDSLVVAGRSGLRGYTGFPESAEAAAGSLGAGSTTGAGGTAYVTDCGSEPELTPVEAVAADGGVSVTYTATATCPEGQWLGWSDQTVDLVVDGAAYLSGVFDFSADPRWIPAEGTDLTLVYPPGSAFATPDEVNDAIAEDGGTGEVVRVDCVRGEGAVGGAVPADPGDAAPGTDPVTSTGPSTGDGESGESALETLQRMARDDAPYLDASVAGSWVPQLSSKTDGLEADGITWDAEEILAEHLRLRLRYPGVRLLWSTDWAAYQLDGYWVTVVADEPSSSPEPALDFCVAQSFDRDHCYAKQPVREGSWEDRTRLLPEG